MRLIANNFVVLSNFVCFTSCLIISSLIWSSLVLMSGAQPDRNDRINYEFLLDKDDINDLSHSLPPESHHGVWRGQHRIPSLLMNQINAKFFKQNDRIKHWLKSQKRQMEEQPPPGFVGARGRRTKQLIWDFNKSRKPSDEYQTLTEVFPDLLPQLKEGEAEPIEAVTEELMDPRLASGKKSDTIVYKDGFLGVRG